MSIIFIGTPEFAVPSLRRLAEDGHEISAVITQPDRPAGRGRRLTPPPVKAAAEALDLTVLQPPTLRDAAVLDKIRALNPETMVAVAYGQILRQELLDIAPRGVLNVHPSLLPRHRGASPIATAILAGDSETGVSIMLMDAGMDSGPLLAQRRVPLDDDTTTGALTESLAVIGADLLGETLPHWLAGDIEPQPQDAALVTTTHLIQKEDGTIDWSLPAIEIARRVRAYNPWPGATTTLNGEALHIWRATAVEGESGEPPGAIVVPPPELIDPAFLVQTGKGQLSVHELQRAGRKLLSSDDFLRGMPRVLGQRLG